MKIYYFLLGDIRVGSTRIRVYYLLDWLKKHGIEVAIHDRKPAFGPYDADIIFYQKVNGPVGVAKQAKKKGIKIVFDASDFISAPELINKADYITTATKELLELLLSQSKIPKKGKVIKDTIDYLKSPLPPRYHTKRDNLNIVYITRPEWLSNVEICLNPLLRLKKDINYSFYYISGGNLRVDLGGKLSAKRIGWNLNTFTKNLRKADIAVAPQPLHWKYESKIITPITHNIPVVCSKTPVYHRFVEATGIEEFCCETESDWYKALHRMTNPDVRNDYLKKTLPYIWKNYNIDTLGKEWMSVFREVLE